MRGHTGTLQQRFSKPVVAGSLGLGAVGSVALGVAAAVTATNLVLVGLPFILLPGLAVGGHRLLNTPSDQPALCGLKIDDMRQSGVPIVDSCPAWKPPLCHKEPVKRKKCPRSSSCSTCDGVYLICWYNLSLVQIHRDTVL